MNFPITGSRGRVVSDGPKSHWFYPALALQKPKRWLDRYRQHPRQRDMDVQWAMLSTQVMRDPRQTNIPMRTFDARKHRAQVEDRLDYLIECGIQPMIDCASRHFMTKTLKNDPERIEDYLEDVASIAKGRCRVVMPFGEMTRMRWRNLPPKERLHRYARFYRALRRGMGPKAWLGVHLRSGEIPPTALFRGVGGPKVLLMHFSNRRDPEKPFVDRDGKRWKDAGEWLKAKVPDRKRKIGGMKGAINFECGITYPGWGPVQSPRSMARRGRVFLPYVLADWATGLQVG